MIVSVDKALHFRRFLFFSETSLFYINFEKPRIFSWTVLLLTTYSVLKFNFLLDPIVSFELLLCNCSVAVGQVILQGHIREEDKLIEKKTSRNSVCAS